jgi:peroxiredoxin Q/BCP
MNKTLRDFGGTLAILGAAFLFSALSPGTKAPDFTAKNQDGKAISLADLKGKYVLLYFYPKDDTPGCTKEACSFRDGFELLRKHGAVVLGVSKQDEKSHQEFRAKYKLPFDLLVDNDGKLASAYGIASMPVVGYFKRESVLIDPNGKILKQYKDVNPEVHSKQVLQDIEGAQGALK